MEIITIIYIAGILLLSYSALKAVDYSFPKINLLPKKLKVFLRILICLLAPFVIFVMLLAIFIYVIVHFLKIMHENITK